MTDYVMPAETACRLIAALDAREVAVCVGGGWAVDALVGLHYGSVRASFRFTDHDLSGAGEIAGMPVRCERPEFALQNRSGYESRDVDRHDVAVLCEHFGLRPPPAYR